MKNLLFLFVCFGLFCAILPALAATASNDDKPPKELVEDISKKAFQGLITVKNEDGKTIVRSEDAKKLKYPLTSYKDREKAVARGYLSEYAKWCKLPWEKDYYTPYIKSLELEHKKNWTPFQYAYTQIIHGMAMGIAEKSKKGETCDAAEKKRIADLANK